MNLTNVKQAIDTKDSAFIQSLSDPYLLVVALHFALSRHNDEMVRVCVQAQADLQTLGPTGMTALQHAVSLEDMTLVECILEVGPHGASHRTSNAYHHPLLMAVELGYKGLVQLLVENGVDVNQISKPVQCASGRSAMMAACELGYAPIVAYLIRKGGKDYQARGLVAAVKHGHYDCVALMMKLATERQLKRALIVAQDAGHMHIVSLLCPNPPGITARFEPTRSHDHHAIRNRIAKLKQRFVRIPA